MAALTWHVLAFSLTTVMRCKYPDLHLKWRLMLFEISRNPTFRTPIGVLNN
ncbi:MAG TPA: hypothetical protein PK239_16340 [Chitinophagales bacterium]|nr:hypothetical protein [Chitinophagales bacterium]